MTYSIRFLQSLKDNVLKEINEMKGNPIKRFIDKRKDDLITQTRSLYNFRMFNLSGYVRNIEINYLAQLRCKEQHLLLEKSKLTNKKEGLNMEPVFNHKIHAFEAKIQSIDKKINALLSQKREAKRQLDLARQTKQHEIASLNKKIKTVDSTLKEVTNTQKAWKNQIDKCKEWTVGQFRLNNINNNVNLDLKQEFNIENSLKELQTLLEQQRCEWAKKWQNWNQSETVDFVKYAILKEIGNNDGNNLNMIQVGDGKCNIYLNAIEKHCNIEGKDLSQLNGTALKIMGINDENDRKKILLFIKRMTVLNGKQKRDAKNNDGDSSDINMNNKKKEDNGNDDRKVENENWNNNDSEQLCLLCCDLKPNMVFVDCGHQCVCEQCYKEWKQKYQVKCPLCQKGSSKAVKIFKAGL